MLLVCAKQHHIHKVTITYLILTLLAVPDGAIRVADDAKLLWRWFRNLPVRDFLDLFL